MKPYLLGWAILIGLAACDSRPGLDLVPDKDWTGRQATLPEDTTLTRGRTYLPVYSHIYHIHETKVYNLTVTVSIRNVSSADTLWLATADYYDTDGNLIRHYLDHPVYVRPMETIELVISENDTQGGSGANFMFDWTTADRANAPLMESVMISTLGQQGLSFTSRGIRVN